MPDIVLVPPLYVNVKSKGAKGDGSTDDTTAIQNALNAVAASGGGTVAFPAGTYIISSSLIIDSSNITMIGLGYSEQHVIKVKSSADPSYALIVGNTQYVANCFVEGLTFVGRNSASTTGGGIKWGSDTGAMKHCKVAQFGGTGIYCNGVVGQIYNTLFKDLFLYLNGMNTSGTDQARSNLYIGSNMANSEYIRVVMNGSPTGQVSAVTKYGIYINNAPDQKFVVCHPYFNTDSGLFIDFGDGLQIIGGEYESNNAAGLNINHINVGTLLGARCYGNGNGTSGTDLILSNCTNPHVEGCTFASTPTGTKSATLWGTSYADIGGCFLSSPAKALELNPSSSYNTVHDCRLTQTSNGTCIEILGTSLHNILHDCSVNGNFYETTSGGSPDYTNMHNNKFTNGTVGSILGTNSVFRNNEGYNPVGQVTAPAFPASGTGVTNTKGVDVTVFVANGTGAITQVAIAGQNGTYNNTNFQIAASGWGTIRIPAGGSVKFTYASGTPSWTWMGE